MKGTEQYDLIKLSENIDRLMNLIRIQQQEVERLRLDLRLKESSLQEALSRCSLAEANSAALLTVRAIAGGDEELRQTKQRLDRLMKDVGQCIKLLEVE